MVLVLERALYRWTNRPAMARTATPATVIPTIMGTFDDDAEEPVELPLA
jgi:hypothetical protein